jgi:GNAT superfamily N-acetyltransferase
MLAYMQLVQGDHRLDDDLQRFDFERCHAWLTGAYWSPGITRAEVERGFRLSTLVVGAYCGARQDGCLRLVSDLTRFAYVMDVFVDPEQRGRGLGRALMRFALDHPSLELVQRWVLGTNDAHEVYRPLGFSELPDPERWMTLKRQRPWL